MAYNFNKKICDKCGIHKDNAPYVIEDYSGGSSKRTKSFRLFYNGDVLCGSCFKEKALLDLFNAMDKLGDKKSKKVFHGN